MQCVLFTDVPFWYPGLGSCKRILSLVLALSKKVDLTVFFLGECSKKQYQKIVSEGEGFTFCAYDLNYSIQRMQFVKKVCCIPHEH